MITIMAIMRHYDETSSTVSLVPIVRSSLLRHHCSFFLLVVCEKCWSALAASYSLGRGRGTKSDKTNNIDFELALIALKTHYLCFFYIFAPFCPDFYFVFPALLFS